MVFMISMPTKQFKDHRNPSNIYRHCLRKHHQLTNRLSGHQGQRCTQIAPETARCSSTVCLRNRRPAAHRRLWSSAPCSLSVTWTRTMPSLGATPSDHSHRTRCHSSSAACAEATQSATEAGQHGAHQRRERVSAHPASAWLAQPPALGSSSTALPLEESPWLNSLQTRIFNFRTGHWIESLGNQTQRYSSRWFLHSYQTPPKKKASFS